MILVLSTAMKIMQILQNVVLGNTYCKVLTHVVA